jgi:peptidoglycan hydrolase-like protein with peptidoglycan-binding domain
MTLSYRIARSSFSFSAFFLPALLYAQTTSVSELATTTVATTSVISIATTTVTTTTITLPDYRDRAVVEAKVRTFFADIPVMISIALCESRFRQFDANGNPLDGGSGGMVGVYQINRPIHASFALLRGFDINTVEGNLGYARYLYEREGTNPWISSFPCWNTATNNPESTSSLPSASSISTTPSLPNTPLTANLSFGMIHPQVLILQKILNASGFVITADGPGSTGNETTKFGSLTRESIRRFQCAKGIVCAGDEGSTGYGYVGNRTRQALLTLTSLAPTVSLSFQSSSPPSVSLTIVDDKAIKIKDLEAQITQHLNTITDLQSQIAKLKNGQ